MSDRTSGGNHERRYDVVEQVTRTREGSRESEATDIRTSESLRWLTSSTSQHSNVRFETFAALRR